MFKIQYHKKAIKEVGKIPKKDQRIIKTKIERDLKNNPFSLRKSIKKITTLSDYYRLRVGNYRILYKIKKQIIIIFAIQHRKNIYGITEMH